MWNTKKIKQQQQKLNPSYKYREWIGGCQRRWVGEMGQLLFFLVYINCLNKKTNEQKNRQETYKQAFHKIYPNGKLTLKRQTKHLKT